MNENLANMLKEWLAASHECDPDAIQSLIDTRVECNDTMRDHPTIQVVMKDGVAIVGILGLLNGLLLEYGSEDLLCSVYDHEGGKLTGFDARPASKFGL